MDKLNLSRKNISEIDRQIAELFEKRMTEVKTVAEYKKEHGIPVFDKIREKELLSKNCDFIQNQEIKPYYTLFQNNVMDISKKYQEQLISGLKVAYSGVSGSYAEMAAKKLYNNCILVPKNSFHDAYYSVENGECDVCVLPIENSYAGEVTQVIDLIYSGSLFINQVINMPIYHALLSTKDASVENIKTVISQSQALKQCDEYIYKNGFAVKECENTALAGKIVKDSNDNTLAAIASVETAELYGLKILEKNINISGNNTTRFASFSRVQNKPISNKLREDEHFIIVFTVQNKAGALAQTLNIIGAHGFNMRNLRSHPKKTLNWEYYFYIEADGNINTQNGQDLLHELSAVCAGLKLVGTYYEQSEDYIL